MSLKALITAAVVVPRTKSYLGHEMTIGRFSMFQFAGLVAVDPEIKALVSTVDEEQDTLSFLASIVSKAKRSVCKMITISVGEENAPDFEEQVDGLMQVPEDLLLEMLIDVLEVNFPGGLDPFFQQFPKLLGMMGLSRAAQAQTSPAAKPTTASSSSANKRRR